MMVRSERGRTIRNLGILECIFCETHLEDVTYVFETMFGSFWTRPMRRKHGLRALAGLVKQQFLMTKSVYNSYVIVVLHVGPFVYITCP